MSNLNRIKKENPTLLNIKTIKVVPEGAIYIGRANSTYGLKESKWANKYVVGVDGSRSECIAKYVEDIKEKLYNEELDIRELDDKDLVCWCFPKFCHGAPLIRMNALAQKGELYIKGKQVGYK